MDTVEHTIDTSNKWEGSDDDALEWLANRKKKRAEADAPEAVAESWEGSADDALDWLVERKNKRDAKAAEDAAMPWDESDGSMDDWLAERKTKRDEVMSTQEDVVRAERQKDALLSGV